MKQSFLIFLILITPAVLLGQWKVLPGPSAGQANDFCEIAGSNGGEIYAATNNGVYRTTDHAKSWQSMGLRGDAVLRIMQYTAPGPATLLSIIEIRGVRWSLCLSNDSGKTWDTIFTVFSYKYNLGILGIVQDGNDIVMGLPGPQSDTEAGIYRSTDIGQHWVHQALAPTGSGALTDFTLGGGSIFAIANDTVWAMPSHSSQWSPTTYPYWHHPQSINYFGNNLFVGGAGRIDISTDNGLAWLNPPNTGLDTTKDLISFFAVNGATIVATGGNGVYRSSDGAISWQHIEGTGGYPKYYSTKSIRYIDGRFFNATSVGAISSADGTNWMFRSDGIVGGTLDVVSNDSILFASTYRGIFRSVDHGKTWIDPRMQFDLVDSNATDLIKTGTYTFAKGAGGYNANGLWVWIDSGWRFLSDSSFFSVAGDSSAIFASTGTEILRTTDSGATWTSSMQGISQSDGLITSLLVASGRIFAFSSDGSVYVSTNEGEFWSLVRSQNYSLSSSSSVAYVSGIIYVAALSGLLYSTDEGMTWDSILYPSPLHIWPLSDAIIEVTNNGAMVLVQNESPINITCPGPFFGVAYDDFLVYVNASGHIYAAPLTSLPLAVSTTPSAPPSIHLSIFPNPSSGRATISFALPHRESISLKLYDERGVSVATYFTGFAEPGQVPIDMRGLASGTYVAVLATPDGVASANIVVIPK